MNSRLNTLLFKINSYPRYISAGVLKWIAIITMFIDHVGAGILRRGFTKSSVLVYDVYRVLRLVGRVSFPIFCFLLVEGYLHTGSRKKYALSMLIFAFLSEIPFDMCFYGELEIQSQNVYFTLFLGLLAMCVAGYLEEKKVPGYIVWQVIVFGLTAGLAYLLKTDYSYKGIGLIAVLFLFRDNRLFQCILGAIACAYGKTAPLAFIFVWLYNGKRSRGKVNKYIYYAVYPVHLMLFYAIHEWLYALCFG